MYDILKKALDEALTENYNAELMSCAETKHDFSREFVSDMKTLIRKTDNKLIYYSKYVAIAACACVAVGCAVLLPNLLNSGIDTKPTETIITTTTPYISEITTTPVNDSGAATVTDVTTTSATTTPTSVTTDDGEANADTSVTTENVVTAPTNTTTSTTTTTSTSVTTLPPQTEESKEDEIADDEIADDEIADDEIVDDDADVDGDVIIPDDGDDDVTTDFDGDEDNGDESFEAEDEIETEEDEEEAEVEDEVDVEEDVEEDVDDDIAIEEQAPVSADTFGEAVGFFMWDDKTKDMTNKLYPYYFNIVEVENGDSNGRPLIYAQDADFDFIIDYLETHKNAPRITDSEPYWNTDDYIRVTVTDISFQERKFYDYSVRNEYEYRFGGEEFSEEVADEEDMVGNELSLCISSDGYIWIEKSGYEIVCYDTDDAATAELFAAVRKNKLESAPETIGDIISGYNITSGTINKAYGTMSGIYDISILDARIDTDSDKAELMAFLEKIKDSKLETIEPKSVNNYAVLEFSVTGYPMHVRMKACENKLYVTVNNEEYYRTNISDEDFKEMLRLICRSGNVPEPFFYTTLEEYLANAAQDEPKLTRLEFTEYESDVIRTYYLKSQEQLDKLYEILSEDFKNADYKPFGKGGHGLNRLDGTLYKNAYIKIWDDDAISVLGNEFALPKGTFDKVLEFMMTNPDLGVYEEIDEVDIEEVVDEEIDD